MLSSWKQLKTVFHSHSGIHFLQLGTGWRDRLCVPPVAPLTMGWLGKGVGWFHDSGFWFEKYSPEDFQVIVFFSEGNNCSLYGRWHLFLESNLSFYIFQLNNYAHIYYYNSAGLLTTYSLGVKFSALC